MANFSSGVGKVVVVEKEVTWGVKPANTGGKYYPRVTLDLNLTREQFSSARINSTAQVYDSRSGTDNVEGTLSDEVAAGSHTDLWAGLLRGEWKAGDTSGALTTVASAATVNTLTRTGGSWITDGFRVGDVVNISGFAAPATANNVRTVITALTATVMTVNDPLVTKAAGDSVTIAVAGNKLAIPALAADRTDDSFTIEQYFSDIAVSNIATGVKVGSASISMSPDAMATVEFGLMGKDMTSGTKYFTSPAAATASSVMGSNKAQLFFAGGQSTLVTAFSAEINGGLEAGKVIGNQLPDNTRPAAAIFQGVFEITGEMSVYFENDDIFTMFRDETPATLSVRMIGDNGKEFVIKFPRLKLGSATPDDKQTGGLIQTVSFTALYNESGTTTEDSAVCLQEILS